MATIRAEMDVQEVSVHFVTDLSITPFKCQDGIDQNGWRDINVKTNDGNFVLTLFGTKSGLSSLRVE